MTSFRINWVEPISAYPYIPTGGMCETESECVFQIKEYLLSDNPYLTLAVENRGVYVLDLTDIKMYHSSKSLKPLWRIGDGFSKTLIAEIVEVGENESEDS